MTAHRACPLNDNEPQGFEVEVIECDEVFGAWAVEAVDAGSEGEVYQTLFIGPDAEGRARRYARTEYGFPSIT